MDIQDADGVGRRVRAARKIAGLTQRQLAGRAHVSVSRVKQVEQAKVPASPAFTAGVARALGLSVADLYDQPTPRFGSERAHVADLETAIMEGPATVLPGPVRPLAELVKQVNEVGELQRRSRYDTSSVLLADVVRHLHVAAAESVGGPAAERSHRELATAYGHALICLHRLGSPLAGLAAERGRDAAALSGDPLLAALADQDRSLPLMHRGAYATAAALVERVQAGLADHWSTPQSLSVRGAMHLRSAIIGARAGSSSTADAHLAEARDLAERLPALADHYDTAFCLPNVQVHAVAAAVELCDGTTAVARADGVQFPAGMMRSRLGHHHVDLARGWLLHGDTARALATLNHARELAPQLVRYHPQVHETVRVIAERQRRASEPFTRFVRWLAIPV